jgi:hypothetical protein
LDVDDGSDNGVVGGAKASEQFGAFVRCVCGQRGGWQHEEQ